MAWEEPKDEIQRLETERYAYSLTFANLDPADTVTRPHVQAEMNRRTERIRKLQNERGPDPLSRLTLWVLAMTAAWGAWEAGPLWLKVPLGLLAVGFLLISY